MMRFLSTLALVALVMTGTQATPKADGGVMVGGFRETKLTSELRTMLYDALAHEKVYSQGVDARVCASEVTKVEQQVVRGMNYRFTTSGCDVRKTLLKTNQSPVPEEITKNVGECKASFTQGCAEVTAVVTVYQGLDESVKVSNIVTTDKQAAATKIHVRVHVA